MPVDRGLLAIVIVLNANEEWKIHISGSNNQEFDWLVEYQSRWMSWELI